MLGSSEGERHVDKNVVATLWSRRYRGKTAAWVSCSKPVSITGTRS